MNQSNIYNGYNGVVTIITDNKKYSLHNSGSQILSEIFAKMLIGQNVKYLIPNTLTLVDSKGKSLLKHPIILTARHAEYSAEIQEEGLIKHPETYRAYFEANVSKTNYISQEKISGSAQLYLNLLSTRDSEIIAQVAVPVANELDHPIFNIDKNTIVIWEMELLFASDYIEEES